MGAKAAVQSWSSIVLGAAIVVLVGWLTMEQMSRTHIRAEHDAGPVASASASASSAPAAVASAAPSDAGSSAALDTLDGGFGLGSLNTLLGDSGAMPTGAPRSVRIGVVLVQFAGAEGAPSSARAKPDALKHAQELAEQAHADFKAAVKAGDSGSSEDIGRIPRGVLDRSTEVVVFSLEKDALSEPLETPRGYWVVKRLD